MICKNCHKEVADGFRFCPYCGKPLEEELPMVHILGEEEIRFSKQVDPKTLKKPSAEPVPEHKEEFRPTSKEIKVMPTAAEAEPKAAVSKSAAEAEPKPADTRQMKEEAPVRMEEPAPVVIDEEPLNAGNESAVSSEERERLIQKYAAAQPAKKHLHPYLVIWMVCGVMLVAGMLIHTVLRKVAGDGEEPVKKETAAEIVTTTKGRTESVSESLYEETETEELPESADAEELSEDDAEAEDGIVISVSQPEYFGGTSFSIPHHTADTPEKTPIMLAQSFFEMKNIWLGEEVYAERMFYHGEHIAPETLADTLNYFIDSYRIAAVYEVTWFANPDDFHNQAGTVFSIVQKNVNDGYPTFFEVDPAYLYGGVPGKESHYVLIKGYEMSEGSISAFLLEDPMQDHEMTVTYDTFVHAVANSPYIFYIH